MSLSHVKDLARKKTGERGKYAEKKVKEYLQALGLADATFDWERIYDARSSMGRIPARGGDYGIFSTNRHGLIEAKEVEHDFRLPKKNFNPEKFGLLKKRMLAGGQIIVVVCHTTTMLWRSPPFQWFLDRAGQPSWDLREFKTYESVDAILHLNGLPMPR